MGVAGCHDTTPYAGICRPEKQGTAHLQLLQLGMPSLLRQDCQALQLDQHDLDLLAHARVLLPASLSQAHALCAARPAAACQDVPSEWSLCAGLHMSWPGWCMERWRSSRKVDLVDKGLGPAWEAAVWLGLQHAGCQRSGPGGTLAASRCQPVSAHAVDSSVMKWSQTIS